MRLLLASLLFFGACGVALAQTTTAVSIGPFWDYFVQILTPILSALALALIGWLVATIQKYFKVKIDQSNRDALHSALDTGINLGVARIGGLLAGKSIDVKSVAVAQAVAYVQNSVPGALAHFGITPDTIATMAVAKLQKLLPSGDTTVVTPAAVTIQAVSPPAAPAQPAATMSPSSGPSQPQTSAGGFATGVGIVPNGNTPALAAGAVAGSGI